MMTEEEEEETIREGGTKLRRSLDDVVGCTSCAFAEGNAWYFAIIRVDG